MPGQAIVTIKDRQWQASLATTPSELTSGLGGIPGIPPETGMFFDTGYQHIITVTTGPMLFPIDIALIDESLVITEVNRNIDPGYLVAAALPARYFFEVNAGELNGIEPGDRAYAEWFIPEMTPVQVNSVVGVGIALMSMALIAGMASSFTRGAVDNPQPSPALHYEPGECEIVHPRHYGLLSWFDTPVPDYSFSIEPETKERKIDEVLRRLKEGVDGIQSSDNFREFLLTMSRFHDYSIGNLILIMLQRKDATRVAGYNTWKDLGRWVRKGESGIAILAPCLPPKKAKVSPPSKAELGEGKVEEEEEEEIRPLYFKVVHVFDISQTEGKELPRFEVPTLTGEANEELFAKVMALAKTQGLEVSFESRPQQDPAVKGTYSRKDIWVRPEEPRAQQLKTLLHEVAHYYSEGVFRISRRDAETIAESAAFAVGAHFGFDTGTRSFPYVALWAQDKKVLEQNLAAIRKVSTAMIDALE